jgi:type I restriction enzyme S subunit
MEKLLDGVGVEWKALDVIFDIFAGGDVPKESFSEIATQEFNIPIYPMELVIKLYTDGLIKRKLKNQV